MWLASREGSSVGVGRYREDSKLEEQDLVSLDASLAACGGVEEKQLLFGLAAQQVETRHGPVRMCVLVLVGLLL